MKKMILGLGLAIAAISCETATTAGSSQVGKSQPSLDATTWELPDVVKGKVPTLKIEGTKITGNAGCNNFFGEVALNSTTGSFDASKVGSTKMFCDNMSVEDNFLKSLSNANRYVVAGNSLELYKDGLLLIKLNKKP